MADAAEPEENLIQLPDLPVGEATTEADDMPEPQIVKKTPTDPPADPAADEPVVPEETEEETETIELPEPEPVALSPSDDKSADNSGLSSIREEALGELKPLLETATLSNEEKFDIYMRLIHGNGDSSLLTKAHEAAKNIEDTDERARALLDVVTEIDFQLHSDSE